METTPAGVPDSKALEPGAVGRHRPSTDTAVLQVVRIALDETWSPAVVADLSLERVDGDLALLDRARARVLSGATVRPTGITERALVSLTHGPATLRLDQALDELDDLVQQLRHTALSAHLPARSRSRPSIEPAQPTTPTGQPAPTRSRN